MNKTDKWLHEVLEKLSFKQSLFESEALAYLTRRGQNGINPRRWKG